MILLYIKAISHNFENQALILSTDHYGMDKMSICSLPS